MGRAKKKVADQPVIRRQVSREIGLFVDGVALDRAAKRIRRRIDYDALLKSLTSGSKFSVARYYTILPNEDDARQLAFLDAIRNAGFEVVSKRLPPKGIDRQVSIDVEMTGDIMAFALEHPDFAKKEVAENAEEESREKKAKKIRSVMLVCPSREMNYALNMVKQLPVQTITADFGDMRSGDILRSANEFVDLSGNEGILISE